ncbi:MAG: alcohol dehydrogenase catalytic domain-containing protein [Anaerolineaceae bacterium]
MGHEPTGTIAKVGSEVTKFKVGDRVFAHHHVGCISCHQCGHHALCENFRKYRLDPVVWRSISECRKTYPL